MNLEIQPIFFCHRDFPVVFFPRHGECKKLGESTSGGLDDVLEEIAKTEQALIMCPWRIMMTYGKKGDQSKGDGEGNNDDDCLFIFYWNKTNCD